MSHRTTSNSGIASPQPRTAAGPARSSPGGLARRRTTATKSSGAVSRSTGGAGGILKWSTEDSPGLKIGPTVVLVISLLFIAVVVLMHILGKFTR